jgi:agmatinase
MIDKSQEYPHTGIPTFLKSDYGSIEQLGDYPIGIFGVPLDIGVSNKAGTRNGPAAIRKASTWYNPSAYFKKGTIIDLYQQQRAIEVNIPEILDLGDVPIFPTDYQKSLNAIEAFSYEVTKRAFPIILGGDHSITYPAVKGLLQGLQEREAFNTLGILHFDSHPDVWDSYLTLDNVWHGSPFRKLLEEEQIQGSNLVMIGDRCLISTHLYDYITSHGIKLYSISDVWERGIAAIVEEATTYLKDQTDGVYISFDIDVLDPAYAPGTGTPVPGGLTPREMIQAVNIICETTRLVGIDLVEVAPHYDPSESTQQLAAFLLHRFIMLYKGF